MLDIISAWYKKNFNDKELGLLVLLLALGFLVLIFLGQILAPVLAGLVIAYVLEWAVEAFMHCRLPES